MTTICDKDHKEEISIHAPHEGERRYDMQGNIGQLGFQSTLPTRGSDLFPPFLHRQLPHFNPRSPRGGATRGCHIY